MRINSNKYIIFDDCVHIITRKQDVIIIDKEDFDKCKLISWCVDNRGYANGRNKIVGTIRLHRYILNPPENKQVDHINKNKLDNRRTNLRIVNNQQNHFNRPVNKNNKSGVTGVHFNKKCNKWCCQINLNGKCVHSELFDNKQDAINKRKSLENKFYNFEYQKERMI